MSEINFELPSGKRKFWIDDHEIITEYNKTVFMNCVAYDNRTIEERLIVKVEALRIEIRELTDKHNELMWKITEMMRELERGR